MHKDALRAAVRAEYGVGIHDVPVLELADMTAWLPAGCALWRAIGGPLAITEQVRALRHIEFRLRVLDWHQVGSKGEQPQPPEEPKYSAEVVESKNSRKAEHFLRRQRMSEAKR